MQVPDDTIAWLYPSRDNFEIVGETENGLPLRSPKSLVALCVDALCRSLPHLEGALPRSLPHDVVDDIVQSLYDHSALNASTLAALRNCELSHLSLAGCRGVTDSWLAALSGNHSEEDAMDVDVDIDKNKGKDKDERNPGKEQEQDNGHAIRLSRQPDDGSTGTASSYVSAHQDAMLMTTLPVVDVQADEELIYMDTSQHQFQEDALLLPDDGDYYDDDPRMYQVTMSAEDLIPYFAESLVTLDLRGCQLVTDSGLMHLGDLYALKEAYLDECHSITGSGLLFLSECYDLVTLSLANCRRLGDEGILHIAHLDSLKELNLSSCRCLTDQSLVAISHLYDLRSLQLSLCDEITDRGLDDLASLERLTHLRLGWCRRITDVGIQRLSEQTGRSATLHVLELSRTDISDECLPSLARLRSLRELDVRGCTNLSSLALGNALANLPHLTALNVAYCPAIMYVLMEYNRAFLLPSHTLHKHCRNDTRRSSWQGKISVLTSLELNYSSVKDSHLMRFLNLGCLEELKLGSCPVGDAALAHLADHNVVPNLRVLDLSDTDVTDQSMAKIAMFTKLERLSLFCCSISNRGLRHIGALVQLQALDLDSRDVTDDGLIYLKDLKKLKSLDLFSGRFTDAGCYYISNMISLESLELCGGAISDMGCCRLASRLSHLANLNLSQNDRITNRGAAALAALTNLETLNLSNTRVDSHGLKFFSDLRKLRALTLYGCRIHSDLHVQHLQNRLPMLRCLRVDSTSAHNPFDGIVVAEDDDDDVDDDSSIGGDWRRW
jgi:Leucine-rich repeat (LRR) protein